MNLFESQSSTEAFSLIIRSIHGGPDLKAKTMISRLSILNDERGISLLEFALTLPLLLTLIYTALEISIKVNSLQSVSAAAQEGVKMASTFKPSGSAMCPSAGRTESVSCSPGGVEVIPEDADLIEVARISTCNYLKEQNYDASNWVVTTSIVFQQLNNAGREFPVIKISLEEQDPSCTICMDNVVSFIPSDSSALMSLQNCQAV